MLFLLVLVAMVAASAAVVAFTLERLEEAVEPKSATTLAACLADNMVPDLAASGEELINRACRERVRDSASAKAACIFARREAMTSDDAAHDVALKCGVQPDDL